MKLRARVKMGRGFKEGTSTITQTLFQSSVASPAGANRTKSRTKVFGTPVEIPSDKKIGVSVTFENTGSESIYGMFFVEIFYADSLTDSSGDPETDYNTWMEEWEGFDGYISSTTTMNPGDSWTFVGNDPPPANRWAEGTVIDAGVIVGCVDVSTWEAYFYDSLKITDAVKIIAPTA